MPEVLPVLLDVVKTIDKSKNEACCQGCNQKLKVLEIGDYKWLEPGFGSPAAVEVIAFQKDFDNVDKYVDNCEGQGSANECV